MANCTNCTSSPLGSFDVQLFFNNQCFQCDNSDCAGQVQNSKCIIYTGPNLSCSGILTNDSIETALQKIDEQICSAIGDYSNYQFNCLTAWYGSAITQESEFVDAITGYACEIRTDLDTFIDTTFVAYQAAVDTRFDAIEVPGITCATASVVNTDTLVQVLDKYCTKMAALTTAISIAGVDWDQCLTVVTPPTTIAEAFSLVIDQICQVEAGAGGALPTFNNTGTCLPTPGASETLVSTVTKIRDYLCLLPELDNDNLSSDCVAIPATDNDLEGLLQNILDKLDVLSKNYVTFNELDFTVSQTDVGNDCEGITVELSTPATQDRFVAVSAGDASPGTLIAKVASSGGSIAVTNDADTTLNLEVASGDYGDITINGSSDVWTIDNDVVTFAKMQNISTSRILGRTTAASGDIEELTVGSHINLATGVLNTYGRTLIGITRFTESGTWTKPAGCNAVIVEVVGAGGGGGGVTGDAAAAAAGGGGGGGGFAAYYIVSGLGATETVTIGAGGTAGSSAAGNGGTGGTSSFGTFVSCTGGGGGLGQVFGTALAFAQGGAYGVPTVAGGTLLRNNQVSGEHGIRYSGTVAMAGTGGSPYVGGKDNTNTFTSGAGSFGIGSGAGGSGAISTDGSDYAGSVGNGGYVLVYELS